MLALRIDHAHQHDREKEGGISFSDRLWLNDECIGITMRGWHITNAVIENDDPLVVKYWVTGDGGYSTDERWIEFHRSAGEYLARQKVIRAAEFLCSPEGRKRGSGAMGKIKEAVRDLTELDHRLTWPEHCGQEDGFGEAPAPAFLLSGFDRESASGAGTAVAASRLAERVIEYLDSFKAVKVSRL